MIFESFLKYRFVSYNSKENEYLIENEKDMRRELQSFLGLLSTTVAAIYLLSRTVNLRVIGEC